MVPPTCSRLSFVQPMNSSHTDRTGFTLVELLVVIAIIGLLVGLLLPAVQAAREAARGMQCKNNLHQIALGVEMFHDTRKSYPPARYQPRPGDSPAFSCGGKETTWLVRIMPYIEAGNLEQEWDYAIPYADHPEKTRVTTLPTYCCPSRRGGRCGWGGAHCRGWNAVDTHSVRLLDTDRKYRHQFIGSGRRLWMQSRGSFSGQ